MRLRIEHPEVAFRDCDHCRKVIYHESGEHIGEPMEDRLGREVKRRKHQRPPCERETGCKKGHWKNPIEMTRRGLRTLELFERSRSTFGRYLNKAEAADPIVAHVHGLLSALHDAREQKRLAFHMAIQLESSLAARMRPDVSKSRRVPETVQRS